MLLIQVTNNIGQLSCLLFSLINETKSRKYHTVEQVHLVRHLSLRKVLFHRTAVPLKFNVSPGQASNMAVIMISIQSDLKHVISPEASIGLNTQPIKLSTVVTLRIRDH